MDELHWNPAHPLCALLNRLDVLMAAWHRYASYREEARHRGPLGGDDVLQLRHAALGFRVAYDMVTVRPPSRESEESGRAARPGPPAHRLLLECLAAIRPGREGDVRAVEDACALPERSLSVAGAVGTPGGASEDLDPEFMEYAGARPPLLHALRVGAGVALPGAVVDRESFSCPDRVTFAFPEPGERPASAVARRGVTETRVAPTVWRDWSALSGDALHDWLHDEYLGGRDGEGDTPDDESVALPMAEQPGTARPETPRRDADPLSDGPHGGRWLNFNNERHDIGTGKNYQIIETLWRIESIGFDRLMGAVGRIWRESVQDSTLKSAMCRANAALPAAVPWRIVVDCVNRHVRKESK